MKLFLCVALLFPVMASAQQATSSGWAVDGSILLSDKGPVIFDRVLWSTVTSMEPYHVDLPSLNFSSQFFNWGEAHTNGSWGGIGDPGSPMDVISGSVFRNFELRVESRQHELLVLRLPYFGSYANVKGFCEHRLSTFTGLDIHGATLSINGADIPLPAMPDEDDSIDLDIDTSIGTSTGRVTFRETTRTDDNSIEMIGIDLQVNVIAHDSINDVGATIDLQMAYAASKLDCMGVPVELQTWTVD